MVTLNDTGNFTPTIIMKTNIAEYNPGTRWLNYLKNYVNIKLIKRNLILILFSCSKRNVVLIIKYNYKFIFLLHYLNKKKKIRIPNIPIQYSIYKNILKKHLIKIHVCSIQSKKKKNIQL